MAKSIRRSVLLATCAVLAAMPSVARADLLLFNEATYPDPATPSQATAIITGLPTVPSLLQLAASSSGPGGVATRVAGSTAPSLNTSTLTASITAGVRSTTGPSPGPTVPTIGSLGWEHGGNVGIGFSPNQGGNAPLTLSTLTITLWNPVAAPGGFEPVGSFGLGGPIQFSSADLTGFGNQNAFNFVLSPDEQVTFNTLVNEFGDGLRVGLTLDAGCPSPVVTTGCQDATGGGAKAIKAFDQSLSNLGVPPPPPPPEIPLPASLPLFASGLGGLGLLGWRRKRKARAAVA